MSGITGRWEYHVEEVAGDPEPERLNALGADRWELVGTMNGQQTRHILVFKRPSPTLAEQITLDQRTRVQGEHEHARAEGSES